MFKTLSDTYTSAVDSMSGAYDWLDAKFLQWSALVWVLLPLSLVLLVWSLSSK
jgi:hypothetical protein